MVPSAKGKEKVVHRGKGSSGKRKLNIVFEDDGKAGGRKRTNRGVLQFFDDVAYEVDEDDDSDDDSFLDDDFLEDEFGTADATTQFQPQPSRPSFLPFVPKQEEPTEEELENMLQERYKPGSTFVTYAEDSFESKRTMAMPECHPSVNDPIIWKVKCMVGKERHSVFCLMQKYVDLQFLGKKLQMISAFTLDHVKGFIYIEAEKQCDIYEACNGLCTIYSSRVAPVPKDDFDRLFSVKNQSNGVSEGMWARVKNGKYKGDLAQVVAVNSARKKVTVKLIPRIDLQALAEKFGRGITPNRNVNPAPRLISDSELKEFRPLIQCRRDRDTNKVFEVLDGMMLKDGYLYKKVSVDSLSLWGVKPTDDELLKFEPSKIDECNDLEWLSELYGEQKNKRPLISDKGGGKGEGSSTLSLDTDFEVHDLVFFGRKDFGVVIGSEKDEFFKIIREGSEGPVVVTIPRKELKNASFDRKLFTALDQKMKNISINDRVRVLDGPMKDREGIVKRIYRGIIFLYNETVEENNGYICFKVQLCEKVELPGGASNEKGGEQGFAAFGDFASSPKSPLSPKQSDQGRDGSRNFNRENDAMFSVGQSLRIRVGPLKGYLCRVLAIRRSEVTVKLDSQHKILTVKCEHLSEVRAKSSGVSLGEESGSLKAFDLLGTQDGSTDWLSGTAKAAEDGSWNAERFSTERSSWPSVPASNVSEGAWASNPLTSVDEDASKGDSSWDAKPTSDQGTSWGAKPTSDLDTSWGAKPTSDEGTSWGAKPTSDQGTSWGAKPTSDEGTSWGAKPTSDQGTSWGAKPTSDQGTSWGAKPTSDQGTSWGAKPTSDQGTSWGAKPISDQGSSWGAKPTSDQGTSWGAKPTSDQGTSWGAKRTPDQGTSWGAKPTSDQGTSWGAAAAARQTSGDSGPVANWGSQEDSSKKGDFGAGCDSNASTWGKAVDSIHQSTAQGLKGDSWGQAARNLSTKDDLSGSKSAWNAPGVDSEKATVGGGNVSGGLDQSDANAWNKVSITNERETTDGPWSSKKTSDGNSTSSWGQIKRDGAADAGGGSSSDWQKKDNSWNQKSNDDKTDVEKVGPWSNTKAPEGNSTSCWGQNKAGGATDAGGGSSSGWGQSKWGGAADAGGGSSSGAGQSKWGGGASSGWGQSKWGGATDAGDKQNSWNSKSNWNSDNNFGSNEQNDTFGGNGRGGRGRGGRGGRWGQDRGGFGGRGSEQGDFEGQSDCGGFRGRGRSGRGGFGDRGRSDGGDFGWRGGSDRGATDAGGGSSSSWGHNKWGGAADAGGGSSSDWQKKDSSWNQKSSEDFGGRGGLDRGATDAGGSSSTSWGQSKWGAAAGAGGGSSSDWQKKDNSWNQKSNDGKIDAEAEKDDPWSSKKTSEGNSTSCWGQVKGGGAADAGGGLSSDWQKKDDSWNLKSNDQTDVEAGKDGPWSNTKAAERNSTSCWGQNKGGGVADAGGGSSSGWGQSKWSGAADAGGGSSSGGGQSKWGGASDAGGGASSGWGQSKWGGATDAGDKRNSWNSKSNWNSDNNFGSNEQNDTFGGNGRGGRGRGGRGGRWGQERGGFGGSGSEQGDFQGHSDRGGFRGRGRSGRGGFGGGGRSDSGDFGGRGGSDRGGFRGRGGFGGRGRGRRDDWTENDSGEDKSYSWNNTSNKDVDWKSNSGVKWSDGDRDKGSWQSGNTGWSAGGGGDSVQAGGWNKGSNSSAGTGAQASGWNHGESNWKAKDVASGDKPNSWKTGSSSKADGWASNNSGGTSGWNSENSNKKTSNTSAGATSSGWNQPAMGEVEGAGTADTWGKAAASSWGQAKDGNDKGSW